MKTQLIIVPPGKKCENYGEGNYSLVADTGEVLYGHYCSDISFAKGDLITERPERKLEMDAKFPNGWEAVHLKDAAISLDTLTKRVKNYQ